LIARPKQRAWKLVAVVASTVPLFCTLSGAAVAQGIAGEPVEDIQSANQYVDDLSSADLNLLQAESAPVAGGAATAEPGDPPRPMDQQRLDPEAAPAQIANEIEQISEANQPLMEGDSSTIAPVQEPLPPTAAESAKIEPVTQAPENSSPTPEEPAANNASSTTSEPVASDTIGGTWRFTPPLGLYGRQLLGLGIIVVSFVLPGLIVSWKLFRARVSILDIIRGKSKRIHRTRAAEPKSSVLRAVWTTDVPRRCRRHRAKHTPRRRDHRKHKDL
jgi:hypothetical protein